LIAHTFSSRDRLCFYSAIALVALASVTGCERSSPPGPESSLELVRRSLANRDSSLDALTDGRFVDEVEYMRKGIEAVRYAAHGHEEHNESLAPSLFIRTWEEFQRTEHSAREQLRPAMPWLGGGRCSDLGSAEIPDAFRALPPMVETWPDSLKERYREDSARLSTLFARRFRCAPGVAIRVVFEPARESGGAPKVLSITRD
jgi:hypothetical protein